MVSKNILCKCGHVLLIFSVVCLALTNAIVTLYTYIYIYEYIHSHRDEAAAVKVCGGCNKRFVVVCVCWRVWLIHSAERDKGACPVYGLRGVSVLRGPVIGCYCTYPSSLCPLCGWGVQQSWPGSRAARARWGWSFPPERWPGQCGGSLRWPAPR